MLEKKIMAYVHQLLDQPSQWQTSQQAGPCSVPKFTNTSITVKHLLIKNKNINQSKSSLLIWHYVSYLFLVIFCSASGTWGYMSPVKRICVFEHSVLTNFNCACPAIQRGQGSGFLSECSSWLTACMSEQRRFWRDCADAQARLNLRCSHRR